MNSSVKKIAEANFPTRWGIFRIYGFEGYFPGTEIPVRVAPTATVEERRKESAVALVMGDIHSAPPLVRIHSQCLTGDVFGSLRCDCRQQLEMALSMIAQQARNPHLRAAGRPRHRTAWPSSRPTSCRTRGLDTVQANEQLGFKADLPRIQSAG